MTIKITPEAVKERIAALESAGELSLKEQFYLEALRLLVAAPDGEQLAIENFRSAMEGIGHIRRTLEETFGGLHGTHVEPDILAECKAICDAIYASYLHAQPAPVVTEVINKLLAIIDRHTVKLGWGEKPITLAELVIARDGSDELEACRAAMLAAAPHNTPALNSLQSVDSVADRWIPVSERMPDVGVKVLCFPVKDEPIHAIFNGRLWLQDVSWSGSYDQIDNVIPVSVTHWMPLPAAPQEVSNEK